MHDRNYIKYAQINYSLKKLEKNKLFLHLGYGNEAKSSTLQTALFYKDHPSLAKENTYPKPSQSSSQPTSTATAIQQFNGYKLRKNHVEKSQEVPFCTNLHIDFLQSPR